MPPRDVRTRVWRNGTLEAENFPLEQLSDYLCQEDCLVWADLCAPDAALLDQLAEELSLDRHAVEDALEQRERPKASRYSTHTFVAAFVLRYDQPTGELASGRISAFVMPRGLVSVRLDETLDIDAVTERWDDNADLIKFGPKAILHGLLDEIVDGYFVAIEALDSDIDDLENALFDENPRTARALQRRTFTLRKSLTHARRTIVPMREVVNTVMRRSLELPHGEQMAPFYEDLYDHVLRAADWTDTLRDMISSIFETNLSLSDLRMNLIMKKLTAWAAIIAVPTAITGYFGQNVPYPGFARMSGYWLSTLSILVIAGALYLLFRRKDWL
jgi:magnesium transporter